jgi:hypothetical protein
LVFWGGFLPANPVHESTTFIALALFMKSFHFDKKIFLQIYFGMVCVLTTVQHMVKQRARILFHYVENYKKSVNFRFGFKAHLIFSFSDVAMSQQFLN